LETNTPREFFEKVLPKRFNPEKAAGVDVIVQLNINGPHGGEWTVTIKDKKMEVKEGKHPTPTITVTMTEKDYMDVINDKMSAERAFMTGKLNFKGSIAIALKLRDMGFL
jgi:putative sterol carrier protein